MIIYDIRTNEWRKWEQKKDNYLAPELYFEVGESPDEKEHHIFRTNLGEKEIIASGDEFKNKFKELCDQCTYVIRKKWLMPKEQFESNLKYFNLSKE
jgi:hypothetical protein